MELQQVFYIGTIVLVLTKAFDWFCAQFNIILSNTAKQWLSVFIGLIAAPFVTWKLGMLGQIGWFWAVVWGVIAAFISNRTYDVLKPVWAWIKGTWSSLTK